MENLTISQVSRMYDVTPRMLRHYEKLGLIVPTHKEDYAYRMYDENAVRRLQQIIILRKLRISLKEIAVILEDNEYSATLEILRKSIYSLDSEISALDTIRGIISEFADRLEKSIRLKAHFDLLEDKELIELSDTLRLSKYKLKEENSLNDLNKANETLAKQDNVRVIMLPPFTVASNHVIGKEPEETVGDAVDKFIREKKLYEIKPDARYFGFNHPNPGILPNDEHGYEVWVTIPDDMEVPAPLVKKHFEGGLYAVMTISFGDFWRWGELEKWVNESDVYETNYSELGFEIMGGCLEEHLNWVYSSHMGWPENGVDGLLDLMMPIKPKKQK